MMQKTAAMKGRPGPQSIIFPAGYAVIGSNQLYCGKLWTITSICRRLYHVSVSYTGKKARSRVTNAGRIRRTNAIAMKKKRSRTIRWGWYFFRAVISIAA
jgi:hypothetical protein